jgi:hypothetical protein
VPRPRHGLHALSFDPRDDPRSPSSPGVVALSEKNAAALGRVVDPAALAAEDGPLARLRIELPAAWLAEPCAIDVTVPPRLVCARCDGGGCDGCGRSGALRAPSDRSGRTVRVALPRAALGAALRIAEPFGPDAGIAQLYLEIREGSGPSAGVARSDEPLVRPWSRLRFRGPLRRWSGLRFRGPLAELAWPSVAIVALAMAAAIVIALMRR